MNAPDGKSAAEFLDGFLGDGSDAPAAVPSARAGHIDLHLKGGRRVAFAYTHVVWLYFNGSGLLQIHLSSHTVSIRGRNLASLYEGLMHHSVTEIKETGEHFDDGKNDGQPVVTKIGLLQKPGPGSGLPDDEQADKPQPGKGGHKNS